MDDSTRAKACTVCRAVKPLDEYYVCKSASDGRLSRCKECSRADTRRWTQANRARGQGAEAPATKACRTCGETKGGDEFYPRKTARDGIESSCKQCCRARRRASSADSRQRETAYTRKWRDANREKYDAYMRTWRSQNTEARREHDRRWRELNPEKKLESNRRWLAENYEAIKAKRAANPEHYREINRRSAQNNQGKRTAREAERRAKIKGGVVGDVDLESLWTGRCGLCGDPLDRDLKWPDPMSKSIDHVIPLSLGGDHVPENVQWAHLFCNVSKGNRI